MTKHAIFGALMVVVVLAVAAACLPAAAQQTDEEGWIPLFNGKDMTGWVLHDPNHSAWQVADGVMFQDRASCDINSETTMGDHELHIEFLVPPGSNSGVYIQGRYEIQVCDSAGATDLSDGMCGAIYGKIAPSRNAAKPAGEWQTFDVTFHQAQLDDDGNLVAKARITVIHNGITIVDDQEIDGVTGAAMDDNEGQPGPLKLQGDHGPIKYRNIKYRPLEGE